MPSVFYQSNLERCLKGHLADGKRLTDNSIGTETLASNQYELNTIWHIIEEQQFSNTSNDYVSLKNTQYFLEQSSIDLKSSLQIIFDVLTQVIQVNLERKMNNFHFKIWTQIAKEPSILIFKGELRIGIAASCKIF